VKLDVKHLDRLIAEELQTLLEQLPQKQEYYRKKRAAAKKKRQTSPIETFGGKQTAIAKSSTKGGHKQTKGQREAAIAAKDAKTKEIQKWNPNYVPDQTGFDPDNPRATDEYGERFDPSPNAVSAEEYPASTVSGTGVREKGKKGAIAAGEDIASQGIQRGLAKAGPGVATRAAARGTARAAGLPGYALGAHEIYQGVTAGDLPAAGEAAAGMLGGIGGAVAGAPLGPVGSVGGAVAGDLAAREASRAGGEGLASTLFNWFSSDKEKDALARQQHARKAQAQGQSVGGKQTGIRSSGVEGGAKLVRKGMPGYQPGKMTYQHQVPGASAVAKAAPKASTSSRMRPPGGWPDAPKKAPAATASPAPAGDAAKKAADAAAKTAKAVSEGVRSTMLTENQIRRFQKLANCESLRLDEGAKPAMLAEAIEIIPLIIAVLGGLLAGELQVARFDAVASQHARRHGGGPVTPSEGFIKPLWNWLTGAAESKAEEGDSSLSELLSTIEFEAEKSIERLSPESIATIQEQFGDDEELGALLAQLAEVEEKDYRGVLSQVAQYIRSKLGT